MTFAERSILFANSAQLYKLLCLLRVYVLPLRHSPGDMSVVSLAYPPFFFSLPNFSSSTCY